jgi:hypothetical protein
MLYRRQRLNAQVTKVEAELQAKLNQQKANVIAAGSKGVGPVLWCCDSHAGTA